MLETSYKICKEKKQKWIKIHCLDLEWSFLDRDFLKLGASVLRCSYVLDKIGLDKYEINDIIVQKNCGSYDIIYRKKDSEIIEAELGFVKKEITLTEIKILKDKVKNIINDIVKLDNFDCDCFQPIYLGLILSNYLSAIEKLEIDKIHLNELYTYDEGRQVRLAESNKIRALKNEFDINSIGSKFSNLKNQTNLSRLESNYNEIQQYGYPINNQYIVLYNKENVIRDGGHRAVCLYAIHGNIEVPVMRIYINYERLFPEEQYLFPFHIINNSKKVQSIVLYGAGCVGRAYKRQINEAGKPIEINGWIDKKYDLLKLSGLSVGDPKCISNLEYDYVIIAVESSLIAEEIRKELTDFGVDTNKIIWKDPVQRK